MRSSETSCVGVLGSEGRPCPGLSSLRSVVTDDIRTGVQDFLSRFSEAQEKDLKITVLITEPTEPVQMDCGNGLPFAVRVVRAERCHVPANISFHSHK